MRSADQADLAGCDCVRPAAWAPFGLVQRTTAASLASLFTLTACAPMPDPDVTVRHFGSTRYWEGAQFRVFTFDPREARTLDDRIRLARAEIEADPNCTWAGAPKSVIAEATAAQGATFESSILAAPVRCTA